MKCKLRVLVAVKPEALSRVIVHLLSPLPAVEIVSRPSKKTQLVKDTLRSLPHLIIVNNRFASDTEATLSSLKSASPRAKLILTWWWDGFIESCHSRRADASLNETFLATQLVPVVRRFFACQRRHSPRETEKRRS